MKRLILSCLLASAFCLPAVAQQYSIDWYKVAGGGGTSTGGNYSLTGGFWALISVVQTPGAPTLYISHSGNTVMVYWQNVSGWTLHQNGSLANTNGWLLNSSWSTSNGTNYLNLASPTGNLFYRLSNP